MSQVNIWKENGTVTHSNTLTLARNVLWMLKLCPTCILFQRGKIQFYIPCTDWTNLCYLKRNLAFSFTNRKSLMLGFYFKHALKLWVFRRKNDLLPITLTCYSTNGTNSFDKSERVWAELFKKTLDQPSKILFYWVRPTLYSATVKAIRWFKWLL